MLLGVICDDPALHQSLLIVKRALSLIQIIGPVLCIISLMVVIIQLVNNPDDKKAKSRIKNLLIALVLLFAIPVLVDATMYIMDDSFKVSSCWKNVSEDTEKSEYIEDDKEKTQIIHDSGEYEESDKKKNDED